MIRANALRFSLLLLLSGATSSLAQEENPEDAETTMDPAETPEPADAPAPAAPASPAKTRTPVADTTAAKQDIKSVLRDNAGDIRECYAQALERNGNTAGKILTRFEVTPDGAATGTKITQNTTKDAELGTCVTDAIGRWTFGKTRAKRRTVVSYPFVFTRLGEFAPASAKGAVTLPLEVKKDAKNETATSANHALIHESIRRHAPAIRRCYDDALARVPTLAGTLTVRFSLSGTGAVSNVVRAPESRGDIHEPGLEGCIVKEVEQWVFPLPAGSGATNVTYGFTLSKAGPAKETVKNPPRIHRP